MAKQVHPLVRFATTRHLTPSQNAAVFKIKYGLYRQLINGHTGASFRHAREWQISSRGRVKAVEVMEWQEKHLKRRKRTRAAKR